MADIAYRTADVDGLTVFYRETGAADAPALVLLHGFPSASHMFRELIPLLADRFHIIAPDLPGFGKSDMPARGEFDYTFEHITDVIDRLTEMPRFVDTGHFALETHVEEIATAIRGFLERTLS
jgi:pimeloyl-ACP methyl ester carboxylesterase